MQTTAHTDFRAIIPPSMVATSSTKPGSDGTGSDANADKQGLIPRKDRIPLLVIEDHGALVSGMRTELAKEYAATYVGTKEEVLTALQENRFALAVVDLTLHQKPVGLELMPLLKQAGIKFLVFSGTAEDWHILVAIRLGARGYVNKRKNLHVLRKALADIANDGIAFPPEIMAKLHQRKTQKFPSLGPAEQRALEIFTTMTDPSTQGIPGNQFISEQMQRSIGRIEKIFRSLYLKFDVKEGERALLLEELRARGYYPGVSRTSFADLGIKL